MNPLRLVPILCLPVCLAWADPDSTRGISASLKFETSGLITLHARPGMRSAPADWRSRSGAVGLNLDHERDPSKPWFIEYQKIGRDWVAAGLASEDRDKVRWGLKILGWGFFRMEADGEFKHPDAYHSASFFVEAVVHTIGLVEASPWRAEFGPELDPMKPKLRAAARWMIRPDVDARNWPPDGAGPADFPQIFGERRYAHRRFLDAAALGGAGDLFGDEDLKRKSVWLVRNGIAMQTLEGVNPERGGPDTSYQALGLIYACRFYQNIADETMRREMLPFLERGHAWLLGRISADGTIDGTGNTRTGASGEPSRDGKPKRLDILTTGAAVAYWAAISGKPELDALALRILNHYQPSP